MIEKAETSLGIPSPTELSAQVEEEEKQQSKRIQGRRLLLCDDGEHHECSFV